MRATLLEMYLRDQNIHLGSSLSAIEILATVVFKHLRRSGDPVDRDWLVLSKGHAAPALYAALVEEGLVSRGEVERIGDVEGILQGHPETWIPGVDASTGSLGQGFSFAVGVAMGIKMAGGSGRVFVIMGDGEQDEGEVWEAMTHAAARRLDNLFVIVDHNGFQLDGPVEEVRPKDYLPYVWRSVGWRVIMCDGHSIQSLDKALSDALRGGPAAIFARTVRGKGVPGIENTKVQKPGVDLVRKVLVDA